MAGEAQDQSIWPLPKFYFSVDIGDQQDLAFQEVSGLETENQVIEYRAGNSKQFSTVKMPGIGKVGNVTLKKGIFVQDNKFWAWFSQTKMNTIKRVPVVIKLLDEKGNATMVWTLQNAFPVKITGTDLKSDGNEVAVETIELAHEGMTIKNG
ncbi:phage tail protein [Trinickia terrae]|uniref:Phage tail protein n=1 Tax=Trinickia terrae TaxID=2571161 RepID=A0A4U1I646_9BURK|nr:phage tail protein [Trinickia terrae]TKC88727.1 phage tail protein [Trinickia terrae]